MKLHTPKFLLSSCLIFECGLAKDCMFLDDNKEAICGQVETDNSSGQIQYYHNTDRCTIIGEKHSERCPNDDDYCFTEIRFPLEESTFQQIYAMGGEGFKTEVVDMGCISKNEVEAKSILPTDGCTGISVDQMAGSDSVQCYCEGNNCNHYFMQHDEIFDKIDEANINALNAAQLLGAEEPSQEQLNEETGSDYDTDDEYNEEQPEDNQSSSEVTYDTDDYDNDDNYQSDYQNLLEEQRRMQEENQRREEERRRQQEQEERREAARREEELRIREEEEARRLKAIEAERQREIAERQRSEMNQIDLSAEDSVDGPNQIALPTSSDNDETTSDKNNSPSKDLLQNFLVIFIMLALVEAIILIVIYKTKTLPGTRYIFIQEQQTPNNVPGTPI